MPARGSKALGTVRLIHPIFLECPLFFQPVGGGVTLWPPSCFPEFTCQDPDRGFAALEGRSRLWAMLPRSIFEADSRFEKLLVLREAVQVRFELLVGSRPPD